MSHSSKSSSSTGILAYMTGAGESFSAPSVVGHPYSKATPGILTDAPPSDNPDPFVTENERLQSVVLTQDERQEGYDPSIAYSSPRGVPGGPPSPPVVQIADIPPGAPRGVQLFDAPVPQNPMMALPSSRSPVQDFPAPPQRYFDGPVDATSMHSISSLPPPPPAAHDGEFNRGFRYPGINPEPDSFHSTSHSYVESYSAPGGVWNEKSHHGPSQSNNYANLEDYDDEVERRKWKKRLGIWVAGIVVLIIILGVAIGVGTKSHHTASAKAADTNSTSSGQSSPTGTVAFVSNTDTSSFHSTQISATSASAKASAKVVSSALPSVASSSVANIKASSTLALVVSSTPPTTSEEILPTSISKAVVPVATTSIAPIISPSPATASPARIVSTTTPAPVVTPAVQATANAGQATTVVPTATTPVAAALPSVTCTVGGIDLFGHTVGGRQEVLPAGSSCPNARVRRHHQIRMVKKISSAR